MSPHDVAEEAVLLALFAMLALSYVLDRVRLRYYRRHAQRMLCDLRALEVRLQNGNCASEDPGATSAHLQYLERRLTAASKRLISWRKSPIEHLIIGSHIDPLLYDYERAGAMTTRLLAAITRQTVVKG